MNVMNLKDCTREPLHGEKGMPSTPNGCGQFPFWLLCSTRRSVILYDAVLAILLRYDNPVQ